MEKFAKPALNNFIELVLSNEGRIRYIEPDAPTSMFPSTCNPSIVYDEKKDCFWLNIRKTSYTLHCTNNSTKNPAGHWGPLIYSICSDRGNRLETKNSLCCLNDPLTDEFKYTELEEQTSWTPQWEFVGREDARLTIWNDELYYSYLVRDDNSTGVGRLHVAKYQDGKLIDDKRLPSDKKDELYCVKNWMPVSDKPFYYVTMSDPATTYDANDNKFFERIKKNVFAGFDMPRGSTQVIPYLEGYLAIVHTCQMWYTPNGRKDARYLHSFVYFDKEFNLIQRSPLFSFLDRPVEFCCGLTRKNNELYITLALQDNVSFILVTSQNVVNDLLNGRISFKEKVSGVFSTTCTQKDNFDYAKMLYDKKDFSGAYTFFTRGIDMFEHTYSERYYLARCIADFGKRDHYEQALWYRCIEEDDCNPEGLIALAMFYHCRHQYAAANYWAEKAMANIHRYSGIYYTKDAILNLYGKVKQQNCNGSGTWKKCF